jgi:acetolactate synthase-1/2/3 large subunit
VETTIIDFRVEQEDAVYPMVPAGADLDAMIRRPVPVAVKSSPHNPIFETGDDE